MNEQHTPISTATVTEDEIDLLALAKTIWKGRKIIILSVILATILGVFVAMLSAKEYTASTVMVPQMGDGQSKLGGLGGLAALAGISMDLNTSAELSPMIYPQIVNSIPFQLELMNTPLNFQEYPKPVTLFDYFTKNEQANVLGTIKKYTIGLPFVILNAIKGKKNELQLPGNLTNEPIRLTTEQYAIKKALDGIITLEVNAKEGYLTLTSRMPEPLVAAQLAQQAQNLLQRYVIEFKIEKAKANLAFIQSRYDETKIEFEKAQVSLAMVTDRSKDFTSGVPRIETDRIQTRYTIAFTLFQELAKQLEQAKIQVKKETPVFTIIEPVTIPSEKTKPKKSMIVAVFLFLGGVIGVGMVFGKVFWADLKKKWNEVDDEIAPSPSTPSTLVATTTSEK